MSTIPLSDEENYAIFTESYGESMRGLGRDQQLPVLKRLYKTLDSDAPQHYIYETAKDVTNLRSFGPADHFASTAVSLWASHMGTRPTMSSLYPTSTIIAIEPKTSSGSTNVPRSDS
ncbi:hypothetical protein GCM10009037_30020 [Halarchaeum grantii]|uniref:Uncharacterized protein n=1 Tax=Halarchaeum grantii TaxID=1193105 RepID=A0A830FE58_9EURY|nr:hypothetical protein [Halarchaeum grantii]GGL44603.1 hypothetical protein GCM10009037_30020 [Halarchaeum grantii]